MRKFIRHPSDIPIEVNIISSQVSELHSEPLSNISEGGLAFHSATTLDLGTVIVIRIPIIEPTFEVRAKVAWCQQDDGIYDIGVEIIDEEQAFQIRMVEQVCHIEHYKKKVLQSEGRELSGKEAAVEWIEKYAHSFPDADALISMKK